MLDAHSTLAPGRLLATLATLALVLGALVGFTALTTGPAAAAFDRDCGDFSNQAAAQDYFLDNGGPNSDPDGLDADGDGIACESNPCPCNFSRDPGGNGGGGGGGGGRPEPKPDPIIKSQARVIKVVDGDTVRVKIAGGRIRDVRLLGIDTPEVFGGRECGGPQASRAMKKLLPRNTRVTLISDRTQDLTDRYDRLLRYVMKGQTDASKYQLRLGLAEVYTVGKRVVRYGAYARTQAEAKRAGRGNWSRC